jgi:adenylate cyclase class 2
VKKAQEVEVKISVADVASARRIIRGAGFKIHKARIFEQNLVLDDDAGTLKSSDRLLRVRTAGRLLTCTFKGPGKAGIHKRREEREFHPDNAAECLAVFGGLGYQPVYSYEKYRTEFTNGSEGVVTLDETPIGVFLELEGPARWIDATAKQLGFSRKDYITASYSALYAEWCREYGSDPNHMRF